ncbi:hypothetical protein QFC21_007345 [Naganishia friedmannii]|uniref:Uncharacterized protein n=1 Tax=Naganishia friedmannii TaxID=89922 RepID=A0ACC2UV76_9TREE|nr:hypothetical protein QFC21_007345 [Naganishia friedmannii]
MDNPPARNTTSSIDCRHQMGHRQHINKDPYPVSLPANSLKHSPSFGLTTPMMLRQDVDLDTEHSLLAAPPPASAPPARKPPLPATGSKTPPARKKKGKSVAAEAKPAGMIAINVRTFRMPDEMTRSDLCERLTQLYALSLADDRGDQDDVRADDSEGEEELYNEDGNTGPPAKKRRIVEDGRGNALQKHDITYAVGRTPKNWTTVDFREEGEFRILIDSLDKAGIMWLQIYERKPVRTAIVSLIVHKSGFATLVQLGCPFGQENGF